MDLDHVPSCQGNPDGRIGISEPSHSDQGKQQATDLLQVGANKADDIPGRHADGCQSLHELHYFSDQLAGLPEQHDIARVL